MEAFQANFDVCVHDIDYIVSVKVFLAGDEGNPLSTDSFMLEVEQRSNGMVWRKVFDPVYIEDLTKKTGHQKKYHIFCRMVKNALSSPSDQLFIDILNKRDIDFWQSRLGKKGSPNVSMNSSASSNYTEEQLNSKRFLILTEQNEFERVHYPLPLALQEVMEPERMIQTIERMRTELESFRSSHGFQNTHTSFGGSSI